MLSDASYGTECGMVKPAERLGFHSAVTSSIRLIARRIVIAHVGQKCAAARLPNEHLVTLDDETLDLGHEVEGFLERFFL
jgi:hypothetical protein